MARLHGLPADPAQIRHQFANPGAVLDSLALLSAAKSLGLKVKPAESRWDRLSKIALPAIAQHKDGHYVILAKFADDKVLVQDPRETRPLVLPRDVFEQAWSGKLILFTRRAGLAGEARHFDFS